MADNITLSTNIGAGAVLATDYIAGTHYQIVKLTYGALDSQTIAASGAGAVSAGVPRFTLASDDPAVALLGTIDTDTGVIAGDTTSIDSKITACDTGAVVLAANDGVDIGDVDVATMPSNTTSSGSITADAQAITIVVPGGSGTVGLQITGTWIGQIDFQGTVDGTNYEPIEGSNGVSTVNATAANDIFVLPSAGYQTIRAISTAWTSGTAVVSLNASVGTNASILTGSLPAGTNSIGTVALSATDNAVLDTIDAVLDTINAKLVTGTVIGDVNLGATDNAVLDSIVTNTTGLAGTVSGAELQVDVVAALPAGTNAIGDVGLSGARTSGGTTLYKNIDVDESEDEVKGTAGQVYWIHAMNLTASPLYLKLYNATAASVTVGTTVPDLTFPIPTQGDTNGAGFTLSIPNGIAFSTAISIAATTGVADNDAGAPAANAVVVNLGYA
jgi:hypothetical protein